MGPTAVRFPLTYEPVALAWFFAKVAYGFTVALAAARAHARHRLGVDQLVSVHPAEEAGQGRLPARTTGRTQMHQCGDDGAQDIVTKHKVGVTCVR